MKTDDIFKKNQERTTDFKFDQKVVNVFDDMVIRSVPYYLEIQRMMSELISSYVAPNTSLYDLGCSTGTTMLSLNPMLDDSIKFVGVDSSPEMLQVCRANFEKENFTRPYDLLLADLNKDCEIQNASVVILCLTLQFVRPLYREKLLRSIYQQLNENGCLILIEKILAEDADLNRLFIKYYLDFKRRNNYDELEISQKREALENVLIPYKLSENLTLLSELKFRVCEVFFKWYNWTGVIAVK